MEVKSEIVVEIIVILPNGFSSHIKSDESQYILNRSHDPVIDDYSLFQARINRSSQVVNITEIENSFVYHPIVVKMKIATLEINNDTEIKFHGKVWSV